MTTKKLFLGVLSLFDIALIAIYYTLVAILLIALFQNFTKDSLYNNKNKIKAQPTYSLIVNVCIEASVLAIIAFFLRKIVAALPTPLKKFKKFHSAEVNAGFLIGFFAIRGGIVDDFRDKLGEIIKRLKRKIEFN